MAGADTALVLADHRRMASCRAAAPATSPRIPARRELLDAGARWPLGIYSAGVSVVDVSARRFAVVEDLNGSAPGSVLTCRRQLAARAGSGRQPAPAVGTVSAVSAGAAGAAGRRFLAASRSRSLITPSTSLPSTTGRWRNPCCSMIEGHLRPAYPGSPFAGPGSSTQIPAI